MSDESGFFGGDQAAGQPSDDGIQEGAAPAESPQFVTVDVLKHSLEELERKIQSMSDKKGDRLRKEVEKRISEIEERYKAVGMQMPDAVKQRIVDEYLLNSREDADEEVAQPPRDPIVEAVNRRALEIDKKYGIVLEQGDPEFSKINFRTLDPIEYLESREAAAKAKAERLAKSKSQAASGLPAARAPVIGQGEATGDLMAQYLREIQQARPGSEEALQIRRKYRQKGLNL